MLSRLVITPWDGKNPEYLSRCIESVKESGIHHQIVKCGRDWTHTMFSMRNDADSIAWVDADDIVYPGAINHAFDLLENTDVGLVYTDECRIGINDEVLSVTCRGPKDLWDIVSHPSSVHHLTVTKKYSITTRVLDVFDIPRIPIDWAMKVDAALNAGMMHADIMGYGWRLHPGQITSQAEMQLLFREFIGPARNIFREWLTGIKQSQ